MRRIPSRLMFSAICTLTLTLTSCATYHSRDTAYTSAQRAEASYPANYADRLPATINTHGERVVMIDPNVHAWGAYGHDGQLIKAGLATAGGEYCPDINRGCKTSSGTFRIQSLGASTCKSTRYPLPRGGAPMPYCMFFNKNQGLHGSQYVMEGNQSHGCVRLSVQDAEWVRFNFATIGTKVIVKPY
jgi:hypothetical protein